MAAKKTTSETTKNSGIEIAKDGNVTSLILPDEIASAIWKDWKPGTVNVCVGSKDNIVGTGTFNRIGIRAAFYFLKNERGNA
ncbi:MAG: hypothetical protein IJ676_04145 [Clostridia bacterium]|nr:hypothetical protein [Clostridia bacterium]